VLLDRRDCGNREVRLGDLSLRFTCISRFLCSRRVDGFEMSGALCRWLSWLPPDLDHEARDASEVVISGWCSALTCGSFSSQHVAGLSFSKSKTLACVTGRLRSPWGGLNLLSPGFNVYSYARCTAAVAMKVRAVWEVWCYCFALNPRFAESKRSDFWGFAVGSSSVTTSFLNSR